MTALSLNIVLERLQRLPTPLVLLNELLSEFQNENVAIESIVEKIGKDPALAATTLRLANSTYYGMDSRIGSLHHAALVLGTRTLNVMAMAAKISRQFSKLGGIGGNWRTYWRHSFASAICARNLAAQSLENSEIAFATALLHDIGRLVLAALCVAEYDKVVAHTIKHGVGLLEAERLLLGLDHAVVGAALAELWNLPPAMQKAIASHHQSEFVTTLTDLVHCANELTQGPDRQCTVASDSLIAGAPVWARLRLSARQVQSGVREAATGANEMAALLLAEPA